MKSISNKQLAQAPHLGCCVAVGDQSGFVIGHMFSGSHRAAEPPPADLRTRLLDSSGAVVIEALTDDGLAFLQLIDEQIGVAS